MNKIVATPKMSPKEYIKNNKRGMTCHDLSFSVAYGSRGHSSLHYVT